MGDLMTRPHNVLCVRLDAMGDVLMTTPAFHALKSTFKCRITLLTSPSGAVLANHLDEVDEVIAAKVPWMKHDHPLSQSDMAALAARLRSGGYDTGIVFTVATQSALPAALLLWMARVPVRLAYARENPYTLLTHWIAETESDMETRHETRRQLDLVAHLGAQPGEGTDNLRLRFNLHLTDAEYAREWLVATGLSDRHWVLVHPGATALSRRYPADAWAQAIHEIRQRLPGYAVVLGGGVEDAAECEAICETLRSMAETLPLRLPAGLTIGRFAAILARTEVLICNNSGPAHLAAALGVPLVDIYALTNPQHTPWQVPHALLFNDVECRFCRKSICPHGNNLCISRVSAERIANAALALLEGRLDVDNQPLTVAPGQTPVPREPSAEHESCN